MHTAIWMDWFYQWFGTKFTWLKVAKINLPIIIKRKSRENICILFFPRDIESTDLHNVYFSLFGITELI